MNFASERDKPIFVTRHSRDAKLIANVSPREGSVVSPRKGSVRGMVVRPSEPADFLVKAAGARLLPRQDLLSVDQATPNEIQELVSNRLEIDWDVKFHFLDGTEFSGSEAAREVRGETAIGKYFLELEKETLRIVQDAFLKGEMR